MEMCPWPEVCPCTPSNVGQARVILADSRALASLDTAFTEKEENDPSALSA
jgi:hypothetical protein